VREAQKKKLDPGFRRGDEQAEASRPVHGFVGHTMIGTELTEFAGEPSICAAPNASDLLGLGAVTACASWCPATPKSHQIQPILSIGN
jgi:hypothetical protein